MWIKQEIIKRSKMENLVILSIIVEMKSTMDRRKSKMAMAEKDISELKRQNEYNNTIIIIRITERIWKSQTQSRHLIHGK